MQRLRNTINLINLNPRQARLSNLIYLFRNKNNWFLWNLFETEDFSSISLYIPVQIEVSPVITLCVVFFKNL